jgi:hypothetical protein
MIKVTYGIDSIHEEDEAIRTLFKFLQDRLCTPEGILNNRAQEVIKIIHENFQKIDDEDLHFPHDDKLEDYELTREAIRAGTLEEFMEKCQILIQTDILLLFKLLETQGFDMWLQESAYATVRP